jgi:Domain of unknown function (DUF4331)
VENLVKSKDRFAPCADLERFCFDRSGTDSIHLSQKKISSSVAFFNFLLHTEANPKEGSVRLKQLATFALPFVMVAGALVGYQLGASDHDDGENANKERNLNLTDVYAFREDWQSGAAADAGNLVLVMNSNPRSLPRTQYYFSSEAIYSFNLTRAGTFATNGTVRPTGATDIELRFQFSAPGADSIQTMTVTALVDGVETSTTTTTAGAAIKTSVLAPAPGTTDTATTNTVTLNGQSLKVFAGLRQDTFFFDVEGFFKWRAKAATTAAAGVAALADLQSSEDFTRNYNVNSIVVSVPKAFFQKASETMFDVWATVSVPAKE